MTEVQLKEEWQYRYNERISILLAGTNRAPNRSERELARMEADQWLADWRKAQELL